MTEIPREDRLARPDCLSYTLLDGFFSTTKAWVFSEFYVCPMSHFFKTLVSLLLFSFLMYTQATIAADRGSNTATQRPNIIIILADDMGYGDIGVNGATKIKTPHIDAIAKQGVNFRQFYASANICTPSRAGLMTGRYPIRTGLGYNVVTAKDTHGLPELEETIGELSKRADYKTMLIGKWHLGGFPKYLPTRHGFDTFYGVPHSNDMANFSLYRGDELLEHPVEQSTLTRRYTREAVKFIEDNVSAPFLLFVSHTMPHIPLYASEEFSGQSDAGVYGDVVEELDASVGEIVRSLKATGQYDNTIIFITSDNGPFFEGSVAGLRGGKGSVWEGAYRVPLVVGWSDGRLKSGHTDAITMNFDIFATVADILKLVPSAKDIDGKSLLPVLRGQGASVHQYLYFFNNEHIVGIRNQQWKFVTHSYYRKSLGAFEKFGTLDGFQGSYDLLFAASNAGGEAYSYAERYPGIVEELKSELSKARSYFDSMRTHPPDKTFPQ